MYREREDTFRRQYRWYGVAEKTQTDAFSLKLHIFMMHWNEVDDDTDLMQRVAPLFLFGDVMRPADGMRNECFG